MESSGETPPPEDLPGPDSPAGAADVALVNGGRSIVLQGVSGALHLLDAATGRPRVGVGLVVGAWAPAGGTQAPGSIAVSPDGILVATVSASNPVTVWDVSTGEQRGVITSTTGTLAAMFLSPTSSSG